MYIGGSITLIAVGAILRYAVASMFDGINTPMIGLILMVVGVIGLVVSLIQTAMMRERRGVVVDDGVRARRDVVVDDGVRARRDVV